MDYCKMYVVCLVMLVLNVVPCVIALSGVTVKAATHNLGDNALMELMYTLELGETVWNVSWFKSNVAGDSLGNAIVTNRNGNTERNGKYDISADGDLMIASVNVEDTGYYSCQVYTSYGNGNGFNLLRVFCLGTPTLKFKEKTISEKETLTFACRLPDGIPTPITTTWIKDGGVLDVSDTEKYLQYTALEIKKVNGMDIGEYHCREENYCGCEGKLSNIERILVLVYPATHEIGENALIKLTYRLQSNERLVHVSWFECDADGEKKGDAFITSSGGNTEPRGRYSLSSDGDLIIANVTVGDTGYYRCEVVADSFGNEYGFNLLTVHDSEAIIDVETSTSEAKENTVNLKEDAGTPTSEPKENTFNLKEDVGTPTSEPKENTVNLKKDFGTPTSEPKENTVNLKKVPHKCSRADTGLIVGMTFVGVFFGILLSSSVFVVHNKRTNSKEQETEATTRNVKQSGAYMEYGESTTENHTYQDIQKRQDNPVAYVNVKPKK